jgi:Restriction alleviation protein Lar
MIELMPCPFCNKKDKINMYIDYQAIRDQRISSCPIDVICSRCNLRLGWPAETYYIDLQQATEALAMHWNKRDE